jgi:ribosomal protein L11 methyltransferase
MLREATFLVSETIAEALGDALMENGALSVSLADADADNDNEEPLYGEPGLEPEIRAWRRSRLTILVDEKDDIEDIAKRAFTAIGEEVNSPESITAVPDADWVKITQAQFGPTQIGKRLWIVPSWSEPPEADAVNIRLDPGVAFGTGAHPTTRLCLTWLDENCHAGLSVLDYGCGTGILAIAAAKLGAASVVGVDIDPQAVEAATANATTNAVAAKFHLPEGLGENRFDVVIANILANPLKTLAPSLLARLKANGTLVLSGILSHQAEDVARAYREIDPCVKLSVWKEEEDWCCLVARRDGAKEK